MIRNFLLTDHPTLHALSPHRHASSPSLKRKSISTPAHLKPYQPSRRKPRQAVHGTVYRMYNERFQPCCLFYAAARRPSLDTL